MSGPSFRADPALDSFSNVLPLDGRKRHESAIVSSNIQAELKFVKWPEIVELRTSSPTVFAKIREAAVIRAKADEEIQDHESREQARGSIEKMFTQHNQANTAAKVIQRAWRRNKTRVAEKKMSAMSDRVLLQTLLQTTRQIARSQSSIEKRLQRLEDRE